MDKLLFKYLPAYAQFLLENGKVPYISKRQLELGRSLNIPLLKFFESMADDQLIELGKPGTQALLTAMAENKCAEFIENSINDFERNQLAQVSQYQVVTDDILLVSQMRGIWMRELLSSYTSELEQITGILDEFETFTIELNQRALNTWHKLQLDLYNQMQSVAKIGNWIWEPDTGKYIWSDELFKIYELEPTENPEYKLTQFNHPDDAEMIQQKMRESIETGEPHDFTYRIVMKDGRIKVLHAIGAVRPRYDDGPVRLFGTLQDVTVFQQKNEQLRRSEDKYQKMIDEVTDYAILLLNENGEIQNWNKGAEKIKGYKLAEIHGQHIRTFYTQEDRVQKVPEKMIEMARQEGRAAFEGWRVRKNGQLFWGSMVLTALHDESNTVIGFTKVTRDLTERKLAEDALRDTARDLEEKNAELKRNYKEMESFSYVASHDLQEPLRKIKIFADQIMETEELSETGKKYFERIMSATDRMQRLINSLLDYSRIRNLPPQREETDLNLILDEIKNNLQETLEETHAIIESEKLPTIKGILVQMYQLFFNIIGNSIKYARPDVPLKIKISSTVVSSKGLIDTTISQHFYKIVIEDNGIGFEQQYADKIFELFQRLHGKNEYSGTGIGLAICKKIVQNHNGLITAEGRNGEGSTFNIYLPKEE